MLGNGAVISYLLTSSACLVERQEDGPVSLSFLNLFLNLFSDPIPLPSPIAAFPAPGSSTGRMLGWFKGSFCLKRLCCFLGASVVYHDSLYCDHACCVRSV